MPWQKGESGNRRGRPRGAAGLAAHIRSETSDLRELAAICLAIARDTTKQARDRLNAVQILADRALGRPETHVSLQAAIEARAALPANWGELSRAQKLAFIDETPLLGE